MMLIAVGVVRPFEGGFYQGKDLFLILRAFLEDKNIKIKIAPLFWKNKNTVYF